MEQKKRSIGINAILNVIQQSLNILFPLITYPYAVRVLEAAGIGKVNYGASIISYFSLIAMLGITTYAVREGAKRKSDKIEFANFVNQVFTINVIFTILSYLLLFITIGLVTNLHDYGKLLLIQSLSIILVTLGVNWINVIFEDFFIITIRSIFTHIFSMVLLFLLVKGPSDYYIYAFLTVLVNGIVCVSNWFYIRRYASVRLTRKINFKEHMVPILTFFANTVAISIYVNVDTTMLGWMRGDVAVGKYTVAVKVYTIVKNMLAAAYMVAVPRLAFYIGAKRIDDYKNLCTDLWGNVSILLLPMSVGVACVALEIMYFIGGQSYLEMPRVPYRYLAVL